MSLASDGSSRLSLVEELIQGETKAAEQRRFENVWLVKRRDKPQSGIHATIHFERVRRPINDSTPETVYGPNPGVWSSARPSADWRNRVVAPSSRSISAWASGVRRRWA